MRLNSESIETILERFDRRDDADADWIGYNVLDSPMRDE